MPFDVNPSNNNFSSQIHGGLDGLELLGRSQVRINSNNYRQINRKLQSLLDMTVQNHLLMAHLMGNIETLDKKVADLIDRLDQYRKRLGRESRKRKIPGDNQQSNNPRKVARNLEKADDVGHINDTFPKDLGKSLQGIYASEIFVRYYRDRLFNCQAISKSESFRKNQLEVNDCIAILEHFLPQNYHLKQKPKEDSDLAKDLWEREMHVLSESIQQQAVDYISNLKNKLPGRKRRRNILGTITGITKAWKELKAAGVLNITPPGLIKDN